ncbi:hypothetical protein GCM10009736_04760 [Actinomadura bangladeshensis]
MRREDSGVTFWLGTAIERISLIDGLTKDFPMIAGPRAGAFAGPEPDGPLLMPRSPGYVLGTPMTPARPPVSLPHDNGSGIPKGHGPPHLRVRRIVMVYVTFDAS